MIFMPIIASSLFAYWIYAYVRCERTENKLYTKLFAIIENPEYDESENVNSLMLEMDIDITQFEIEANRQRLNNRWMVSFMIAISAIIGVGIAAAIV